MSRLFSPYRFAGLEMRNRVVMSPMQRWQGSPESYATAYHIHHYGRCAAGSVGLVIVESTAVAASGRLYSDDIGIFSDNHVEPLRKVVQAVKAAGARVAIQLSHGGRKSFPPPGVRLLAPSAIAHNAVYGMPEEMSARDIADTIEHFALAARRGVQAGFEATEIHAAHGYLLHQFLSPLSNRRTDRYGGSPENRARMLHEIYDVVRAATGPDHPIFVRVSASDYTEGGLTVDAVAAALAPLVPKGLAAVDVSSGGLVVSPPPNIGPGYQVPLAEELKRRLGVPIITVGLIRSGDAAERIVAEGRADMIAIGRPLLENPSYAETLRKGAEDASASLAHALAG